MEASNPEYVWNSDTETSMSDAFNRLRWSIFEDISNIRVADNLKLLPFDDHPIAAEAATKIPLKEIAFTLDVLDTYESDGFEAPDRLLVRRADGGIITVADVVEQLSAYFIAHKEETLEAKAPFHPSDDLSNTRVFFDGLHSPLRLESTRFLLTFGPKEKMETGSLRTIGVTELSRIDLCQQTRLNKPAPSSVELPK